MQTESGKNGARIIDPTPEELKTALRLCAIDEPYAEGYPCERCYLYPFRKKDGHLSTGEACFECLALDAIGMIDRLNTFEGSQLEKMLAENGRLRTELSASQAREKAAVAAIERIKRDMNEPDKVYIHLSDFFGRRGPREGEEEDEDYKFF